MNKILHTLIGLMENFILSHDYAYFFMILINISLMYVMTRFYEKEKRLK